jgi:hypothetical protein
MWNRFEHSGTWTSEGFRVGPRPAVVIEWEPVVWSVLFAAVIVAIVLIVTNAA